MATHYTEDKSKYRDLGTPYTIDSKHGRSDSRDKVLTTPMTVSGTAVLLPTAPMGRRNYIKVQNMGPAAIEIRTSTTVSGIQVASGGVWEENNDSAFYVISTGAATGIVVYERSTRFNYKG